MRCSSIIMLINLLFFEYLDQIQTWHAPCFPFLEQAQRWATTSRFLIRPGRILGSAAG